MKWPCSIIMQITCLLNNIPPISVNKKQLHAITESENCNHWVHTFGTSIIPSLIILCRPPIATYGVCRPYEYTFFLFTEHFHSVPPSRDPDCVSKPYQSWEWASGSTTWRQCPWYCGKLLLWCWLQHIRERGQGVCQYGSGGSVDRGGPHLST